MTEANSLTEEILICCSNISVLKFFLVVTEEVTIPNFSLYDSPEFSFVGEVKQQTEFLWTQTVRICSIHTSIYKVCFDLVSGSLTVFFFRVFNQHSSSSRILLEASGCMKTTRSSREGSELFHRDIFSGLNSKQFRVCLVIYTARILGDHPQSE